MHTTYSSDSLITPKDLIYYAKKRGLNAVAVTDHNSLEGAYKIAKETDFLVIPGMEVSSSDGHIVALNVLNSSLEDSALPKPFFEFIKQVESQSHATPTPTSKEA